MFGLTVGDALGAHVEFRPNTYLVANPVKDLVGGGTWGLQRGQFTDDTSMALCLANSLIACRDFVPYDQLVRYKWWHRHGYMSSTGHCFDIGAATRQSIQEFEKRQRKFAHDHDILLDQIDSLSDRDLLQAFDVHCSKEGVAGNGALMRLAPVPLFFYRHPKVAVDYSGISGQITHGDEKAYDACRYYGALIVATVQGEDKSKLTSNTFYDEHQEWFGDKTLYPEIMTIAQGSYKKKGGYQDGIRGKGYIVNALEAALWAFWSDGDSFETGALNAVNLGDDTDTTAAIYGQLAGVYYGYNKLPKKWLESIYAKEFIQCVSSWIAFEGEQWFKNQGTPNTRQLINSGHHHALTLKSIIANIPSLESHLNRKHSLVDDFTSNTLVRKAITPEGRIGHCYDGWKDHVLQSLSVNPSINPDYLYPPIKCEIKSGDKRENRNLLRLIDFPADLRLSVLSNLVEPTGIASVVNYPFVIDEYTRIFYYSYLVRNQALLDVNSIQPQIGTASATHVITAVDCGIDVVVLLRLPPDDSGVIDNSLREVCEYMKHDTKPINNEHALNRILSTYIYSNRSDLTGQSTLLNVCQAILNIKNNPADQQPCNYILHPINSFHSDQNQQNIAFFPIEPKITTMIEDHWLRLSSVSKLWETFRKNITSDVWQSDLKKQFDEVHRRAGNDLVIINDYIERVKDIPMVQKQLNVAKGIKDTSV
ncbi:unnamed protein product [Rotaria sp. Silwood1]|nr:unnamed protein product [Rotaria sp. Silwood1]CAF1388215.1 unnamed protein product [Rotaria sp. Silwood1]